MQQELTPQQVVPFRLDFPASHLRLSHDAFRLPLSHLMDTLKRMGVFTWITRSQDLFDRGVGVIPGRRPTARIIGPRTCVCANKEKQRVPQFALDPGSRRVIAAQEHIVNELTCVKAAVVSSAMTLPKVKPDLLIHDDACHFEAHVKRSKVYQKAFRKIRRYIIDEFHQPNHKCKKRARRGTSHESSREEAIKHVRANMAETFNCWFLRKNFAFNSMAPHSHRFWVCESIHFWN